jgi:hypothetical protein
MPSGEGWKIEKTFERSSVGTFARFLSAGQKIGDGKVRKAVQRSWVTTLPSFVATMLML